MVAMIDLDELVKAEEEAYAALQERFIDALIHEASKYEWGEVVSAYREAIERRVRFEEGAKLAGVAAAHSWMGGEQRPDATSSPSSVSPGDLDGQPPAGATDA